MDRFDGELSELLSSLIEGMNTGLLRLDPRSKFFPLMHDIALVSGKSLDHYNVFFLILRGESTL